MTPRRPFDFVPPVMLWTAGFVYCVFVLFVIVAPELWGAGYWNILYVSILNLFFAGLVFRGLYGRFKDPYMAYDDRLRRMTLEARIVVFGSIAATAFLMITVAVKSLQPGLEDVIMSLYLQLIAGVSLIAFRIDNVDFEVYRDDGVEAGQVARAGK